MKRVCLATFLNADQMITRRVPSINFYVIYRTLLHLLSTDLIVNDGHLPRCMREMI